MPCLEPSSRHHLKCLGLVLLFDALVLVLPWSWTKCLALVLPCSWIKCLALTAPWRRIKFLEQCQLHVLAGLRKLVQGWFRFKYLVHIIVQCCYFNSSWLRVLYNKFGSHFSTTSNYSQKNYIHWLPKKFSDVLPRLVFEILSMPCLALRHIYTKPRLASPW